MGADKEQHVILKKDRRPVLIEVPPKTTYRVALRFEPFKRAHAVSIWRRLTFSAGGPPIQVTGRIVTVWIIFD